jgi:hypothetical protein
MPEYNIDEFLDMGENVAPTTYGDEVEKKVSLLYDFAMLGTMRGSKIIRSDKREAAVRKLLNSYKSTVIMDNAIHGVLVGDYTIDEMLQRKGIIK